ncbi:MAG TPA: TonB-dependent receptor [Ohtaekwangia sp.]
MAKILTVLLILQSILTFAQDKTDSISTVMLSEVTVQSTRAEEDTLQNFFRANRSATLEDILNRVPGVCLIRRSAYGQEPVLRGMSGGQINVTIDGMKMFGACTDKMDPVTIYIEPQNLKTMDVKFGSNGAIMGSTVGGTLDMKLAPPVLSPVLLYGKAGVGFQSAASGMNAYSAFNLSGNRHAYNASVSYRKANDYRAGGGTIVEHSQYEKLNFAVGGKWAAGQDTLQANMLWDNGWNIGFPALPMDVGLAKARMYAVSFQRYRCHQRLENLQAKIYYNSVHHTMDDSQREDVIMHMDMPGESTTSGLYVEGKFQAAGKHTLSFRSDFYLNKVLAEMVMYPDDGPSMYMQTWPSSDRSVSGIYIQDNYRISYVTRLTLSARLDLARTTINPGLGRDQLEVFYDLPVGASYEDAKSVNINVRQLLSEQFILDIHAGYGERFPTLSETYGYYLFNRYDGYDYIGNPNLNLEKSWSGDVTLNFYSDRIQAGLSGFYQYMPDYIFAQSAEDISPMTPGARGVKVYHNISSATLAGGELSVLARLTRTLQVISVSKYTWGADHSGWPLPLIAPLSNTTTLQLTQKQLTMQLECESGTAQRRVNESFGEDETPAYAVFNARLGYNFQSTRMTLNAGFENIFDKAYYTHMDWGNVLRPGRNFLLTLELKF